MKRFISLMLAALVVAFVPARADEPTEEEAAQLTGQCGEIKNRNSSYPFGDNLWLEYIAETARPVNTFECPWLTVSVEAYVVGVSGSAHSSTDTFVATSRRQVPVPHAGEWQTNSTHYRNYLWIFSFNNGALSSKAHVEDPPAESDGEGDAGTLNECSDEGPCLAPSGTGGGSACPIIIDADRNGYHLTSVEDGVLFDIDADGTPDRVAWTRALSEDAFLALDRNGNGRIDDGSELFGEFTPVYGHLFAVTAANGFDALRFLESPIYGSARRNHALTEHDAAFAELRLWTDRNHNGLSEPDELQPLHRAGLVELGTEYKTARRRDAFGNEFRLRARARWVNGEAYAYDVWLKKR